MSCVFCFLCYIIDIWEENEYTKLKRKFLNLEENGPENIIIEIKKNVKEKEWKDIMKKLTTQEFIEKAKQIHKNKYDYSIVNYKNNNIKIKIICPIHGEFFQSPRGHLSKKGCSECRYENLSNKLRLTNNEFIYKANKVHNNFYNYSKFKYNRYREKIQIICPIHGIFLQRLDCHLSGQGCPKCKNRSNKETFVNQSNKVHNNFYDYSKSIYIGCHKKIKIICPIHGIFLQLPSNHLCGSGCSKCSKVSKPTTEEFIQQSKKIHGNKYDYSKVNYINSKSKIEIRCQTHGSFFQRPDCHLAGQGCSKCNFEILLNNWNSNKQIKFLKYLKIKNKNVFIQNFNVDGYDKNTNIIYEFLGNYWHGNPQKFNKNDLNKTCNRTFGELYDYTFQRFKKLKENGYIVKYIWESDWDKWNKNKTKNIPIKEY